MANWCWNNLKIQGHKVYLDEFKEKFKGKGTNWPPAQHMLDRAEDPETYIKEHNKRYNEIEPHYCFDSLYPVPKNIIEEGYSNSGYNWCITNWGTKWDLSSDTSIDEDTDSILDISFDTAWSPPVAWLEKVAKDYPQLKFELKFEEGGMAFAGYQKYIGGKLVDDDYTGEDKDYQAFVIEYFGYNPYEGYEDEDYEE